MGGAGPFPLEPDAAGMRVMTEAALAFVTRFIEGQADAPVSQPELDPDLHARIRATVGEAPGSMDQAISLIEEGVVEGFSTTSPGFMAYIPGGGLYAAAVADLIADGINRYVPIWNPAPAMAEIEWRVVRWLCDLFGYPEEARGILTSGGSMANFSAVIAARHNRLPDDFRTGTLYATDQVHHSVTKAAMLAGFPPGHVRIVPHTPHLRMDVEALAESLAKDRAEGLIPFMVAASAGTTNTGAIDPIERLADVAAEEGLWLHVDGAYGGFFQLTDRGRRLFTGIDRADSITLDPHKCMFLPYGTGALVARDGEALRAAHTVTAHYLQDLSEGDIPNAAEYGPEFTRDFRGLRVWLPLVLHGVQAFRDALDEKLDLTRWLSDELRATPGFELPWEPELSVVAFRYVPRSGDTEAFNRRLIERINASRRIFLSSTMIDEAFYIRVCIVVHRTHRDRVEEALDIIRSAAAELDR